MVERAVCAAVTVNVLGTIAAVEATRETGGRFVLISSDKAAAPHSVMGASKRLAEMAVMARAGAGFQPLVVRFGNVLGSSGSLVEIVREAIRRREPVPVTDPDATRYFMSAGEAVSLVMKASLLAGRAETYWLDMGRPVRIGDVVDRLIALETPAGQPRIEVRRIGLRPGEKRREELTTQGLRMCRTRHPRIWVARQRIESHAVVFRVERRLRRLVRTGDAAGVLATLAGAVPDFTVSTDAWRQAREQSAHLSSSRRRTPERRAS
jgi:FlaA1/EpsC-like NDP-sugar epimerase